MGKAKVPVDEAARVHPGGLVGKPVAEDLNKAGRSTGTSTATVHVHVDGLRGRASWTWTGI
jgi:hypothetical protein